MRIRPSRHARNNMRLYGILEEDIIDVIQSPDHIKTEGGKAVAIKKFADRFSGFPIKVVYIDDDENFIITAYPLKKGYGRQRT